VTGFGAPALRPICRVRAIGLLVGINLIFWGIRALIGAQILKRLFES
jgi:uncharacterized membrane protein HdeD (DUF308 family)